ncbi:hypothetical protein [Streptosporangium sp. CA-115845]|uniref:hypothetical protein n=1 Tax=Streptosporangium sp. CA-115845 TaxID=3240071 RepID=UPI003D92424D
MTGPRYWARTGRPSSPTGLARGLLRLGLSAGDRILELRPNDRTLAMAGLVRVPLNPPSSRQVGTAPRLKIRSSYGGRAPASQGR